MSALYRNREDCNRHVILLSPFGQLVDVIDGHAADILTDDLTTNVKTRNNVQAIVFQAMVLHQCSPQATGSNDHRTVVLVEAQKILQLSHQALHFISDACLASNVEK